MSYFSATATPNVTIKFVFSFSFFSSAIFIFIFLLMLLILATYSFLLSLATTPPHLTTPFTLMEFATPIKVFFFVKLHITVLTGLLARVKLSFSLYEFLNASFVFISLCKQMFSFFLKFIHLFSLNIIRICFML